MVASIQDLQKLCILFALLCLSAHGLKLQPPALESKSRNAISPPALVTKSRDATNFIRASGVQSDGGTIINICRTPWGENVEQSETYYQYTPAQMFQATQPYTMPGSGSLSWNGPSDAQSTACLNWFSNIEVTTGSPMYGNDATWEKGLSDFMATPGYNPDKQLSCMMSMWMSQKYVEGVIDNWQHGQYGGSWVIPTWMYACSGSGAHGDPHVVNIRGEKFDIASQGEVELIHYPQGAENSSAKLIITTSIDKLGSGCHDTYMKSIKISGTWLKEIISFKDDEDTGDILVAKGVTSSSKPMEWARMHGPDAEKFQGEQIYFETRKRAKFEIAKGTKVIVYTTGRVHQGIGTYLNLELQGFAMLEGAVGGLLGLDSHQKEKDMAKEMCKKSRVAKSRALHQKTDDLSEGNRGFHITIA